MRHPSTRRGVGLVLAVALAASVGCGDGPRPGVIVASGHVEATDVRISTKVPGRIQSLLVREGDRLRAGDELARIDPTDLRLAQDEALAELETARAELGLRLAGARKEDIAELEARLASSMAELGGSRKDLERMQVLSQRGSGTEKSLDDARTRYDMAAASVEAVRQALARARAGSRPEEIAASRARVAVAEARVARMEQQLRDATITSPVNGIVTEKLAELGELLVAGAPVAVITALDQPWLTVYVGALDLPRIRIGQEARVVTDDGQARSGTVTYISPVAEFTPKNVQTRDERIRLVYKVEIGLSNPDGMFKPGMPAEARLPVAGPPGNGAARGQEP